MHIIIEVCFMNNKCFFIQTISITKGGSVMRDNTNLAVTVFFSLLGFVATIIFSSVIITQNNQIKSKLENAKQT